MYGIGDAITHDDKIPIERLCMIRFYQTFPTQSGLSREEVLLLHMQGL